MVQLSDLEWPRTPVSRSQETVCHGFYGQIYVWFYGEGFRVGDRMALFPVRPDSRWRLGRHLGTFKWRYLRKRPSDSLHVWCKGGVFGLSGSNGAISGLTKYKPFWKIEMAISPWQIVRFTPCLVLEWGFRGRRIEWHYFELDQIWQVCGRKQCERSN